MSVLLKEIRLTSREAASVLEGANLHSDTDIQSLTQEDLRDLFPGTGKFKLRKTIFEIIHKQKPVDVLITELKDFLPRESLRAALTSNGVLVEYLRILKDMKTQMNNIQGFLDAHIALLEEFSKSQSDQESDKGSESCASTSASCGPVEPYNGQTGGNLLGALGTATSDFLGHFVPYSPPTDDQLQRAQRGFSIMQPLQDVQEVMYQVIVRGETFGAHHQLMDKVKERVSNGVWFNESTQDFKITVVFCPVSSRAGSDVEAALNDVKVFTDDKPVILVLMHHKHDTKYTSFVKPSYASSITKVVLHVNAYYHETKNGLLKGEQNNAAATEIRRKLLEYSTYRCKDTSDKAVGVPAEISQAIVTPVVRGGSIRGSNTDSGGYFSNLFLRGK